MCRRNRPCGVVMGCQHRDRDLSSSGLHVNVERLPARCSRESSSLDSSTISSRSVGGENLGDKFSSALNSLRLFFASKSFVTSGSSRSSRLSSGYGSLDSSWELDESYVKVSKFSDFEECGEFGHYGTYKEYKEMALQQRLASEIKNIVECSPDVDKSIKISDYLTLRTANDVVNLSKCEPCGLKGCKLIIIIQDGDDVILERSIFPEKGLMCTFEISIVLHLKKRICQHFKLFDKSFSETFSVMEQYELRKEKLYTSKHRKLVRTHSAPYPRWNPPTS